MHLDHHYIILGFAEICTNARQECAWYMVTQVSVNLAHAFIYLRNSF